MTVKTFYRVSLALPIALPLIALPFWFLNRSGNAVVFFLMGSLYLGGLPYLIAALGVLRWMRGKNEEQVRRASFLAPLIVLPICWLCWAVFFLVTLGETSSNWVESVFYVAYFSLFEIVIGYAYVAVVHVGLQLFRVFCWVQDESAA